MTALIVGTTPRSVRGVPCEPDSPDGPDNLRPVFDEAGLGYVEIHAFSVMLKEGDTHYKYHLDAYVDEDGYDKRLPCNRIITGYVATRLPVLGAVVIDTRYLKPEHVNRLTYYFATRQAEFFKDRQGKQKDE